MAKDDRTIRNAINQLHLLPLDTHAESSICWLSFERHSTETSTFECCTMDQVIFNMSVNIVTICRLLCCWQSSNAIDFHFVDAESVGI